MYAKSNVEGNPTPWRLIARREPKLVLQLNLFLHNTPFVVNVAPSERSSWDFVQQAKWSQH
jgi:hypothetical protein